MTYYSIGANRQTAASDWADCYGGVVAFGADVNLALWRPSDQKVWHPRTPAHKGLVKAVKFLPARPKDQSAHIVSGGDDKCIKLWSLDLASGEVDGIQTVEDHTAAINCIATLKAGWTGGDEAGTIFVTGAADATVKIWTFEGSGIRVLQTIQLSPKYLPLALAVSPLGNDGKTYMIASAGTKDTIQIFTGTFSHNHSEFRLQATLSGHEGWIRSLDFTPETPDNPGSDLLLASASQDKYVRLWRVHQGQDLPAQAATASDPTVGAYLPGRSPSNKAYRFKTDEADYSVTFEALLFNHDDWIYSARWSRSEQGVLRLLSASADNSLVIWECDPSSGIWVPDVRLGEISREKGATTATGSIGGFWTGLWSPSGSAILTIGRTGSWRRWDWNAETCTWDQGVAVSGHTKAVTGLAWARSGDYLLSTSSDQTTRLHARWTGDGRWYEMARPQIHGYDLNCVDVLGESLFVSGADEKLMRVFKKPRAVAKMLRAVAGIGGTTQGGAEEDDDDMPEAANMPVLGLSNKATVDADGATEEEAAAANPEKDRGAIDPASIVRRSALDIAHPPLEESLSRHTLWPEVEKLYGHGYEISCLAASHDGRLVASACRASSLNHAVIRIFETERWTELRPPLAVHTSTIFRLRFSSDDRFLLSVGKDRRWTVFKRDDGESQKDSDMCYKQFQTDDKGHKRMVLDAAWGPVMPDLPGRRIFATASRDKSFIVWAAEMSDTEATEAGEGADKFHKLQSVSLEDPITAIDFLPRPYKGKYAVLAVGTEKGHVRTYLWDVAEGSGVPFPPKPSSEHMTLLELAKPIRQLAWRPGHEEEAELAVAGEDGSVRICSIGVEVPQAT
ncbi:WD repeat domain-containing protein [Diaporthe amygdali]|uniref:WD repeat domain-containing protein n=1 Tax=Phomopsis amygdali TaxID=1214568 RepID=UPI0022FE87DC|nr:WD repeat domain-containing protein [Diaporthe amygdali]KAJ0114937.1 WD repeat domain-containing protein [Diaporthe amygdali]